MSEPLIPPEDTPTPLTAVKARTTLVIASLVFVAALALVATQFADRLQTPELATRDDRLHVDLRILDLATLQPVQGQIEVLENEKTIQSLYFETGAIRLIGLQHDRAYRIRITAKGYRPNELNLSTDNPPSSPILLEPFSLPIVCTNDAQCDDANNETLDTCINNRCQNKTTLEEPCTNECQRIGQTLTCEDNTHLRQCGQFDNDNCLEYAPVACPNATQCQNGTCIPGGPETNGCQSHATCNDGNPQTADYCNLETGQCQHENQNQTCTQTGGTTCTPNQTCTGTTLTTTDTNTCCIGTCQNFTACNANGECEDSNACTTDICQQGNCVHANATNGTICGNGLTCQNGACVIAPACQTSAQCNDTNACTTDTCTSGTCAHTPAPNGTACGSGLTCQNGTCSSTSPSVALCGDGYCSNTLFENAQTCSQNCIGTCGDGTCNLRVENHIAGTTGYCPSDCTGTYYAVNANDAACSNNGPGSLAQPFCNLSASFSRLNPGDTVYLRGGNQPFGGFTYLDRGGAPNQWITIRNYPNETPLLDSGTPVNANWNQAETIGPYTIWWTDTTLGTFDPNANGGEGNYPFGLLMNLDRPFSRLLRYEDMQNVLSVPQIGGNFNAYFIDCTNVRLYIRLPVGTNPANQTFYYPGANRIYLRANHIRFIGLTIQHGLDGIKMNPLSSGQPSQFIEAYDNTIRSIDNMGIGDHSYHATIDNYFVYQNNRFENIGPVVVEEDASGWPAPMCYSQIAHLTYNGSDYATAWKYSPDRWLHAVYGNGTGNVFSNNTILNTGLLATLGTNRNSRYYNNYIQGPVYGGSENIEFFNNIVDTPAGPAISMNAPGNNLRIYNNLLAGTGIAPFINQLGANSPTATSPTIEFRNNIVWNKASGTNAYCTILYTYTNLANLTMNNNLYLDCQNFSAGGTYWNAMDATANFTNWKTFLQSQHAGNESASAFANPSAVLNNPNNGFSQTNFDQRAGSPGINTGFAYANLQTDFAKRLRDAQTDIGPYEYTP